MRRWPDRCPFSVLSRPRFAPQSRARAYLAAPRVGNAQIGSIPQSYALLLCWPALHHHLWDPAEMCALGSGSNPILATASRHRTTRTLMTGRDCILPLLAFCAYASIFVERDVACVPDAGILAHAPSAVNSIGAAGPFANDGPGLDSRVDDYAFSGHVAGNGVLLDCLFCVIESMRGAS